MKIAVVVGGDSQERDVSLASGSEITKALRSLSINTVVVDTSLGLLNKEQENALFSRPIGKSPSTLTALTWEGFIRPFLVNPSVFDDIDVFFLALHGGSGENGKLQAFFDLIKKPYTGSGHLASACAMDKILSKKIMVFHDIPTPHWRVAKRKSDFLGLEGLDFPVVVKPNQQGSTVGLTVVHVAEQLAGAIEKAKQFDDDILIETFIPGKEITVGVLDGKALSVGEIVLPEAVEFDYLAKYQPGFVQEIFPANIPLKVTEKLQQYAEIIHQALGLSGYSRTDFRLDSHNHPWCLEVNALPGMTKQSLLPQSAFACGISFPELCLKICQLAKKSS